VSTVHASIVGLTVTCEPGLGVALTVGPAEIGDDDVTGDEVVPGVWLVD